MRKLVLLGAGGHCKSVLDTVLLCGIYDDIVFIDNKENIGVSIRGCKIIGTDDDLEKISRLRYRDAFVAVGPIKTTAIRRKIYKKLKEIGYRLINVIDPTSNISEDVRLGEGIFVEKKVIIKAGSQIENMAIINSGAIVEHDCVVKEFSHVSIGALLCGNVEIGSDCFIGANATVIQKIHIHSNSMIKAGEVINKQYLHITAENAPSPSQSHVTSIFTVNGPHLASDEK